MLQALTALSRARRRPLDPSRTPLRLLLGGHVVTSGAGDLGIQLVSVDPIAVRELIDVIGGEEPARIQASLAAGFVVLRFPLDASLAEVRGSPLIAIAQSLQQHAGTLVETLAAGEVMLGRSEGRVGIDHDGVRLWLPRVEASGSA